MTKTHPGSIFETGAGYYPGPWSGEDGGPRRLQTASRSTGPGLQPGETLRSTRRRVMFGNMVILREPGEVYLMTTQALRHRYLRLPTTARIEKIHPESLKTIRSSPKLSGGPFWPAGFAVHRNGDLYVTFGRWCHRLDPDCNPVASHKLPLNRAYNSFVILDNGLLVMKNFSDREPARLSVLDPATLEPVCVVDAPEPSIARLGAAGDTVYLVGVRSVFRYHWNANTARLDLAPDWRFNYIGDSTNSYGWDPVIGGDNVWFMDNGKHRYMYKMRGAGVHKTAVNLIRVALENAADHTKLEISGLRRGTVTNPPFFAADRRIALGFDSGNSVLRAWHYDHERRTMIDAWRKDDFGASSHFVYFPATGEIAVNDFRHTDHSVLIDLQSGREKGRVSTRNIFQGVIFPAPGWNRDYYYIGFDGLVRVFVE